MRYLVHDAEASFYLHSSVYIDFNRDGNVNARDLIGIMNQITRKTSVYGGAQTGIAGKRDPDVFMVDIFALKNGASNPETPTLIKDMPALNAFLSSYREFPE